MAWFTVIFKKKKKKYLEGGRDFLSHLCRKKVPPGPRKLVSVPLTRTVSDLHQPESQPPSLRGSRTPDSGRKTDPRLTWPVSLQGPSLSVLVKAPPLEVSKHLINCSPATGEQKTMPPQDPGSRRPFSRPASWPVIMWRKLSPRQGEGLREQPNLHLPLQGRPERGAYNHRVLSHPPPPPGNPSPRCLPVPSPRELSSTQTLGWARKYHNAARS